MPTKFCTTVTVLPPRPAFTRMMSTRPLDLRGGSFRFVSFELPGGSSTPFKSANGLLKSPTLDLCPFAIQCPCIPETTPILQSPRLMPKRSVSPRLLFQLLAKQVLPSAAQHGLQSMDRCQIEGHGALGPRRWSIPGGEQQRFDQCFPSFRHQIIDYVDAPSNLAGAQRFSEEHFMRVFVQQPWSDVAEYHHEMNVRPENRSCL